MLRHKLNSESNRTVTLLPAALARPGAVGAGKYVTGGRFGSTYKVTTLDAQGEGSLYDILRTPGAKQIVFEVSGNIDWSSLPGTMGEFCEDDVSIYGQSAPEGGITITGAPFRMGGGWGTGCPNAPMKNVKIEHVRFRNKDFAEVSNNPRANGVMSEGGGSYYISNCSFSFNNDQGLSMKANYGAIGNCTFTKNLFAENATNIIAGSGTDTKKTGAFSYIKNLFVKTFHRTPNISGQVQVDVIGNVMFNIAERLSTVNTYSDIPVNYMYNHITEGQDQISPLTNRVQNVAGAIYTAYNYHSVLYTTPQENDWSIWRQFGTSNAELSSAHFVTKPYDFLGDYKTETDAAGYRTLVLADVGANMYLSLDGSQNTYIDTYDQARIDDATNFTFSDPKNKVWTLPTLPTNTRDLGDTAGDGIPDVWKLANGYDINTNYEGVIDPNTGYSILELWIYDAEL